MSELGLITLFFIKIVNYVSFEMDGISRSNSKKKIIVMKISSKFQLECSVYVSIVLFQWNSVF